VAVYISAGRIVFPKVKIPGAVKRYDEVAGLISIQGGQELSVAVDKVSVSN
jgi:hypothetical protein